jgi:hypothetical protein
VAETSGLLNRRRGITLPRVRIPPSPPRRYPAAEGNAYVVGGLTASYLRRGDVVLIPIRMGVGARLGVNAGYMRFSEKNRWLPF